MARIQDLALYLSNKHKISKKEAERFLTTVVDVLNDALHYEKQAKVKGLGTFKVIEVKDRESVNVNTGERIVIEGRPKITFTADAVMKELVNKPFAQFDTVALNDGVTFDDMPEEVDVADEENVEPTAAETIVEEAVQEPAETEPQPELEQLMDDIVTEEQTGEELEEELPAEEPAAPVAETEAVAAPVEETPAQEEIPVIVKEIAPVAAEEVRAALVEEPEQPKTMKDMGWEGKSLVVNKDGSAVLTLGPEANDLLAGISFSLYLSDEKSGTVLWMGTDNVIFADWEKGVFTDNFRGSWGAFGGQLVFMELSYEGDGYNLYAVPVLINGEEYKLDVAYDFGEEAWTVLGARKPVDANGMADKNLYTLEEGDKIDLIWYMAPAGTTDFEPYVVDSITYDADTVFEEAWLPDDTYTMVFQMRDASGEYINSNFVDFRVEGENIYAEPK